MSIHLPLSFLFKDKEINFFLVHLLYCKTIELHYPNIVVIYVFFFVCSVARTMTWKTL
jgi:hypothetical protein